ncbi:MAG: S41 family peptidase [Thermomicrobiales bacterium]
MKPFWLLATIFMILSGCSGAARMTDTATPQPVSTAPPTRSAISSPTATAAAIVPATPSPTAQPAATLPRQEWIAYLDEGLDYIEQNALYRTEVDWPTVRARAHERASTVETRLEIYEILRDTLDLLGDDHSAFLNPIAARSAEHGSPSGPMPEGRRLEHGIAYFELPRVTGTGEAAGQYAETAVQVIRQLDSPEVCGWVVDLRENSGGNMWPMLAGISPILGDGVVGSFVYPDGSSIDWTIRDGRAYEGDVLWAKAPAYIPENPQPPVAVLTGHETGSSGEAVAIAFRGRPETRSFGQATAGVPTSNDVYEMPDGAWIILTVARMADRTGQPYDAPIIPDVQIEADGLTQPRTDDPVLDAAVEWLDNTFPACGHDG